MIGIAFGYPDGSPSELKFARIERGPMQFGSEFYWRRWNPNRKEELAEEILSEIGHRSTEISGFTLFWNGDRREGKTPGWQMSVRRKGEEGWDVSRIDDAQAQSVFSILQHSGHPDGPWKLEERVDARDSYIVPQKVVDNHTCRHGRPLDQDCFACSEDDGIPVAMNLETGLQQLEAAVLALTDAVNRL